MARGDEDEDESASDLAVDRYRMLVEQLRDELGGGHGWQQTVADRLGLEQPHPKYILDGKKRAGLEIIARAVERLRLRSEFFFDANAGDHPDYHAFVAEPERPEADPPHWREFLEKYEHAKALSADDLKRIRGFYGREHRARSWTDWERLAEWLRTSQSFPSGGS